MTPNLDNNPGRTSSPSPPPRRSLGAGLAAGTVGARDALVGGAGVVAFECAVVFAGEYPALAVGDGASAVGGLVDKGAGGGGGVVLEAPTVHLTEVGELLGIGTADTAPASTAAVGVERAHPPAKSARNGRAAAMTSISVSSTRCSSYRWSAPVSRHG